MTLLLELVSILMKKLSASIYHICGVLRAEVGCKKRYETSGNVKEIQHNRVDLLWTLICAAE